MRLLIVGFMGLAVMLWSLAVWMGLKNSSMSSLNTVNVQELSVEEELARLPRKPEISQASIDRAIAMYQIQIPKNVKRPVLVKDLVDRGVTLKRSWLSPFEVEIGPNAFLSWALLGSTLAHELEVHCRQSFAWVKMADTIGLDGTAKAEREAYKYELAQAERFGLSQVDQDLIRITVDYFYPNNVVTPFKMLNRIGLLVNQGQ
jgi:hypothetical protein